MSTVEPIRDKEKIEHMKFLLKLKGERDHLMFILGLHTGLRISDILPLKVKDVRDKSHIVIKIQKNTKGKDKPKKITRKKINDYVKEIIDKYIKNKDDEEYLFQSRKGGEPITRIQAYRILNNAAKTAKVEGKVGTHTLRKSFAYHIYRETNNIALVMDFLDHSREEVTKRYIGINQEEKDNFIDNFRL